MEKTLQSYKNIETIIDSDIKGDFSFEFGDVKLLINYDSIVQSIRNILNTTKGELPGLNEFGCSLRNFLFEQMTVSTVNRLKNTIINEIQRFENRVEIIDFKYELNKPVGSLIIDMIFRIKSLDPNQYFRESFLLSSSIDRK